MSLAMDAASRSAALAIDRSILLQAPAGSGKTTVLVQRFLRALADVLDPEEVLAITFTRKAAAEMRERVLRALEPDFAAATNDPPLWSGLRAAVLQRAAARNWSLPELPARLRIQTIDSLNHEIARAMPLLGRMQANLIVVDDASTLYRRAAVETLQWIESHPDYQADADLLLQRLDNNLEQAADLLAQLLPARNRWQEVLLSCPPEALAERVATSLARITHEALLAAQAVLPLALREEGAALAQASAQHRHAAGQLPADPWQVWLAPTAQLSAEPEQLAAWQAMVDLLLKDEESVPGEGRWRKVVNVRSGFPTSDRALKQRWSQWRDACQALPGMENLLIQLEQLPPPHIDATEGRVLAALARIMLVAGANLKLVFREQGYVDHSEVAAVARQALRDAVGPTSLAVRQTLRIRHLLVDEFQDTSLDQLDLLRSLVEGWDNNDGRSLFVVGDPMQSIYLFRNAEVGLFLQVRRTGIGPITLESLTLTRNFRSLPELIEWSNSQFPKVFPAREDIRSSAVPFLAADPARQAAPAATPAVTVWPQPTADSRPEAEQIAAEIQRLRREQPAQRIAVLLQTRASAVAMLRALRAAELPTVAVDLASLADRAVVRDLVALGQALLHPLDRSAWLAVLRAPFCGICLQDLERLGSSGLGEPLLAQLGDAEIKQGLSEDGQARVQRVAPILRDSFDARGQSDFATLLEICWRRLGGEWACAAGDDIDAAQRFLLALRRELESGTTLTSTRLQEIAARLRDRGETPGANPVEVMTIHRAKGLEWDVVFLPGLGRKLRSSDTPLLRWLQLPTMGSEADLLMATRSLGEGNASDALARYLRRLQAQRERHERIRLLYVAVTRARDRLILTGHAPWVKKAEGLQPQRNSLLELLWPAVAPQFAGLGETALNAAADFPPQAGGVLRSAAPWRRFAADFRNDCTASLPPVQSLARSLPEGATELEFSWVRPLARAMGTVMHGELERLALQDQYVRTQLPQQLPWYVSRLRELGVAPAAALQAARQIAAQLQAMVADPTVRWLLDASHREAHSEWALSGLVEGELRSVVIDRSFIDPQGQRWVIDYKHSAHSGGGVDEFLQRELLRYTPQLRLYVMLARRVGAEPVRAALYFTQLQALVELPLDGAAS